MNALWRMLIVILAAIDGGLAAFCAGEEFWTLRGPGGEAAMGRAVQVLFIFAPLGAAICGCIACVLISRSGGFSLGNPLLTKWEKGFTICSIASIAAFARWIALV